MRKLMVFVISFLIVSTALAASARNREVRDKGQNRPNPRSVKALIDDIAPPCGTLDGGFCEQPPPPPDSEPAGNYSYCVARSSQQQMCQAVVTFIRPGTVCATGCDECASVKFSAACDCDNATKKTTGKCTYW